MSAWTPNPWEEGRDRPARLPAVEDLRAVDGGYDRASVEAAFAAFHDHAAKLDRTLEVLEAVAAFQQQAGELRADIRALRAAAWGPLPVPRSSWGAAYATRAATRDAALPAALPRLAVEAAFIILVAVGAVLADLGTPALVGAVLAAWVIVALIEVIAASTRAQRRVVAPAPVAAGPLQAAATPRPRPLEDTQEGAVVFEPDPELEAALEYEPELEAESGDDEEEEADEDLEPAADAADPWAESGGEPEEAPAEGEEADTGEQSAVVSLVPEPAEEPEQPRRLRFWRRRRDDEEPIAGVPVEGEAEPDEGREGAQEDERHEDVPARSFGRRGRR